MILTTIPKVSAAANTILGEVDNSQDSGETIQPLSADHTIGHEKGDAQGVRTTSLRLTVAAEDLTTQPDSCDNRVMGTREDSVIRDMGDRDTPGGESYPSSRMSTRRSTMEHPPEVPRSRTTGAISSPRMSNTS